VKRRYKLPILLAGWWFSGVFLIPWIGWSMPIVPRPQWIGVVEALILLACMIGSLVWLVWPPEKSS
jgi:hypothetical protein